MPSVWDGERWRLLSDETSPSPVVSCVPPLPNGAGKFLLIRADGTAFIVTASPEEVGTFLDGYCDPVGPRTSLRGACWHSNVVDDDKGVAGRGNRRDGRGAR